VGAFGSDDGASGLAFVAAEVVQGDDIARREGQKNRRALSRESSQDTSTPTSTELGAAKESSACKRPSSRP
jgi:hypothetical protein